MSPTVKTQYSRQEIREVREAFRERAWFAGAMEPDGRVTVLQYALPNQETRGFLCRCAPGWFWVADAGELADKAERETPHSWNMATRDLGGDAMRVPTEQELEMGGFRITVDPEPEEFPQNEDDDQQEPAPDEAAQQLEAGFKALDQFGFRRDDKQTLRAQTHFMASIAISLYELVALHKKYDIDNLIVDVEGTLAPPKTEVEKFEEDERRPEPVPGDPEYPYAR